MSFSKFSQTNKREEKREYDNQYLYSVEDSMKDWHVH